MAHAEIKPRFSDADRGFFVSDWPSQIHQSVAKQYTSPYTAFDGTLRVAASWSVRENGPRFPTRGLVRRIFHAVPYGMSVNATYDPTGQELLFITIDFSTL